MREDDGGKRRILLASLVAIVGAGGAFLALVQVQSLERRVATLERRSATPRSVPDGGAAGARAEDAGSEADLWSCSATLPPEALRAFLAGHGRDVLACGEERARGGASVSGTVVVRVRFDGAGRTTHVRFAGALRDTSLEACVASRARTWRTSPLASGDCATIELPFRIGSLPADAGTP